MTSSDELAVFYRRCNEHRFEDLGEFVAPDVVINGVGRRLDTYAENLRSIVRAFPDYRWELQHLVVDAPWIAVHLADTGTHFYRIDAGRIAEVWGMAFHINLLEQIR